MFSTIEDDYMKNLTTFDNITYDAMIIVYYCFNLENHKLVEYTNKSQRLTEFLINNNINIIIPLWPFRI